jgi:hypothetical protein
MMRHTKCRRTARPPPAPSASTACAAPSSAAAPWSWAAAAAVAAAGFVTVRVAGMAWRPRSAKGEEGGGGRPSVRVWVGWGDAAGRQAASLTDMCDFASHVTCRDGSVLLSGSMVGRRVVGQTVSAASGDLSAQHGACTLDVMSERLITCSWVWSRSRGVHGGW